MRREHNRTCYAGGGKQSVKVGDIVGE